jgi:hypothetical protein
MDVNIPKFDPAATERHRIWLIIGCRGSGKSVLLKDLLFQTRSHYDAGTAMTATHTTAEVLRNIFPPDLVHEDGYNFEVVDKLLAFAKDLATKEKERNFLLLLDDCAFDDKIMKSSAMKEIHLNGRHSRLTLMSTTQYMLTVSPLIRTNIDYVFALADNNIANRKRLYNYFFGCFPTFGQFDAVFREVTRDYGCLVLDNTNKTGSISDSVSWYKAAEKTPDSFQLMKRKYYQLDHMFKVRQERRRNSKPQREEEKVVSVPKLPQP